MSNNGDFKDFEEMTEKKLTFSPSKLVAFPSELKGNFKEAYDDFILINIPLHLSRRPLENGKNSSL